MSEGERRVTDTRGKFLQAVRDGRRLDDAGWTAGRILLSTKRLVLAGSDGKRTIPLAKLRGMGGRYDVNQAAARVPEYVSLQYGNDVVLVAPRGDRAAFERDLYTALLDGDVVLVRHPAVEGGVVQDTEWEKARFKLGEEAVNLATASGDFIEIALDDIGSVEDGERTVAGESRSVVEVEHTQEAVSVRTYLSGADRQCSFMESLFRGGERRNEADLDLSESEKEVLMALYSGVSPFEIPDFTGVDVDEVEATFERLIELDVLDEVRKRREVTLTTRGRNLASQAINEK